MKTEHSYDPLSEALDDALLSAFPSIEALRRLVQYKLGLNLNELTSSTNLATATFDLVTHCRSQGLLDTLVQKAHESNPGNAKLLDLLSRWNTPNPQWCLERLVEFGQNQCTLQIDRYARAKYLPMLYVAREAQTHLTAFHQSETELACKLRSDCTAAFTRLRQTVDQIGAPFRALCSVSSITPLLQPDTPSPVLVLLKYVDTLSNATTEVAATIQNILTKVQFAPNHKSLQDAQATLASLSALFSSLTYNGTPAILCAQSAIQKPDSTADPEIHAKAIRATVSYQLSHLLTQCAEEATRPLPPLTRTPTSVAHSGKDCNLSSRKRNAGLVADAQRSLSQLPAAYEALVTQINGLQGLISRAGHHCVVLVDRAGGGKTNLLCHSAVCSAKHAPTLLLFGKESALHAQSITVRVQRMLGEALCKDQDIATEYLISALTKTGQFLHVFIDGINECRDIAAFDIALAAFLKWSAHLRIRVTITCRDIYWDFFKRYEEWSEHVHTLHRGTLYSFSSTEYQTALQLYLKHYHLSCSLHDTAKETCQHPLLLRFFCEAYGSLVGPGVALGAVRDIRLKELFDVYFSKKMEHICSQLGHKNADVPTRFLFSLAQHMFNTHESRVLTYDLEKATGLRDTSTEDSVYLRVLDEDIIIEEEPSKHLDARRVHFVYEEFMEYVLARSLAILVRRDPTQGVKVIFADLEAHLKEWVNALGVAEYLALMLVSSRESDEATLGLQFLKLMVQGGDIWTQAFWEVIGKLPDQSLTPSLQDLFRLALEHTTKTRKGAIRRALETMAKASERGANKCASTLLWSFLLPNHLTWSDERYLLSGRREELEDLYIRVRGRAVLASSNVTLDYAVPRNVMEWILPYLPDASRKKLKENMKAASFNHTSTAVRKVFTLFPRQQFYAFNGLFSRDVHVACACAERLAHSVVYRQALAYMIRLAIPDLQIGVDKSQMEAVAAKLEDK